MTASANRKYNPGFLTDDELVASFCIRTNEFESMTEMLRACTGSSNQHQIVIGPRGSGKTCLLLRVAAEVRRDADLAQGFFPIVFAEESYEVSSAGEFWLECLARLADQAPRREDAPDLHRTFEELHTLADDQALEERCLAAVLDFADREGKRLVLLVENLNMMFGDITARDVGWRLRQTLQTEPRIVLLASATSRFEEIDAPDRALYDLFRILTLRPLDTIECTVLWETVSGQSRPAETIRSLEILTGGSPRLLTIVARFGAGLSFHELMDNLLDLVDDHTEYFKSHLESLPAQERRVYLALADLWKPALTKEIADRARLSTSKCSAHLKRLIERGVVLPAGGSARRKQYYLSERLYNVYYLLRRRRGPSRLIEALIQFMAAYYSPGELRDIVTRFAHEIKNSVPERQSLHKLAHAELMAHPALAEHHTETAGVTQSTEDERVQVAAAIALYQRGVALSEMNRLEDALAIFEQFAARFGDTESLALLEGVAIVLLKKGNILGALDRPEEKLAAYEEVLRRFGGSDVPALFHKVAAALYFRGITLSELDRPEEGLTAYEEILRRFGEHDTPALLELAAKTLFNKGIVLGTLDRPEEELAAYEEVLHRFGRSDAPALVEQVAKTLVNKGIVLGTLNRPEEGLAAYEEVLRRFGRSDAPALLEQIAKTLFNKGIVLGALDRPEEELAAYEEILHRFGRSDAPALLERVAEALVNKGFVLGTLDRQEEELAAYDEVLRRFGGHDTPALCEKVATALLYQGFVLGTLDRPEEELRAYDEVLRRFGGHDTPALCEVVARALLYRGITLHQLDRPEEALAAYEEVLRRFGRSDTAALHEQVAKVLVNKGIVLGILGRPEEELAAYEEVSRRFSRSDVPALLEQVAKMLVIKGIALGALGRLEEALVACGEALRRLDEGGVQAILDLGVDMLLVKILINLSVDLGPARVRDAIQASPAATLFLPLTAALEQEMGLRPRVALEVEEVAADIRERMTARRDGSGAASAAHRSN